MIKRTFTNLDRHLFLILYKSLVRPIIDYGIVVWYPSTKKHIQTIENIQRRATKLVNSLKNLPYEERLRQLNLPTLLYRRERYDQIQVFKIINNFDNISAEKFFQFTTTILEDTYLKFLSHV